MTMQKLTPNLMVRDVRASAAFYAGLLGLTLTGCVDEAHEFHPALPDSGGLLWAVFSEGEREMLMIQRADNLAQDVPRFAGQEPGGTFTLYFETDDLDALFARANARVATVKPVQTAFYGMREWYVADPDGYVVCLAQKA